MLPFLDGPGFIWFFWFTCSGVFLIPIDWHQYWITFSKFPGCFLENFISSAAGCLNAIFVFSSAYGFGNFLPGTGKNPLSVKVGMGLSILSVMGMFLVVTGLFSQKILGILLLTGILLSFKGFSRNRRAFSLFQLKKSALRFLNDPMIGLVAKLYLLLLPFILLTCFRPVTGNAHSDVIMYSLSMVKDWLLHSSYHEPFWVTGAHLGFPLCVALLQLMCSVFSDLNGWYGVFWFNIFSFFLTGFLVFQISFSLIGRPGANFSLLLFLLTPGLFSVVRSPLQDPAGGLFVALFLHYFLALLNGNRGAASRFWWIAGFVVCLKYFFLGLIPGLIIWFGRSCFKPGISKKALLVWVLLFLSPITLWYGKNLWLFGSITPSTSDIVNLRLVKEGFSHSPGKSQSPEPSAKLKHSFYFEGEKHLFLKLITLPFRVTFNPDSFKAGEGVGVIYLLFLPFIIFLRREKVWIWCAVFFLPVVSLWFLIHPLLRYTYPLFPLMVVAWATMESRWRENQKDLIYSKRGKWYKLTINLAFIFNFAVMGMALLPKKIFSNKTKETRFPPVPAEKVYETIKNLDPAPPCLVSDFQNPFFWNPYFYLSIPTYLFVEAKRDRYPAHTCLVALKPVNYPGWAKKGQVEVPLRYLDNARKKRIQNQNFWIYQKE